MVELASQQPVSVKGPIKLIGWLAFLAALTTIPLISIGGAVTTYGAGMAVPDWPTTFGENMFLYNMFESSFGVIIEHSHRLFGSLVGLLALINCIVAWFGLGRSRLTTIITLALSLVIVQGLLGFSGYPACVVWSTTCHGSWCIWPVDVRVSGLDVVASAIGSNARCLTCVA